MRGVSHSIPRLESDTPAAAYHPPYEFYFCNILPGKLLRPKEVDDVHASLSQDQLETKAPICNYNGSNSE